MNVFVLLGRFPCAAIVVFVLFVCGTCTCIRCSCLITSANSSGRWVTPWHTHVFQEVKVLIVIKICQQGIKSSISVGSCDSVCNNSSGRLLTACSSLPATIRLLSLCVSRRYYFLLWLLWFAISNTFLFFHHYFKIISISF